MDYRVELSGCARDSIDRTVAYLSDALDSPSAAAGLLEELERKIDLVRAAPRMYPMDEGISELVGYEMRSFTVKRYVVWYTLDEAQSTATIVAFLHGSQDAERWLFDY